MAIKRAANGRDAALGVCVGGTSPNYVIGQPGLDPRTVDSPGTPITVAAGASGTMSGQFQFACSFVIDGFETGISPWSETLTITSKKASLSDVPNSADTRCDEKRLYMRYRASSAVAWGAPTWIGGIYDNTTQTATIDIAGDSKYLRSDRKPRGTDVAQPCDAALASPAAAGNVDDGVHLYAWVAKTALGNSVPGPTKSVNVADKATNGKVVVPVPTATGDITGWDLYRSEAGQTDLLKHPVHANVAITVTSVTDDSADSALGAAAPTVDTANVHELSGNFMVPFIRWDSVGVMADYTQVQPAEIGRGEGKPAGVPDDVKVAGQIGKTVRASELALMLCGALGAPTVTAPAGGVWKLVWDSRDAKDVLRALSLWWYNGGTASEMGGQFFWHNMVSQAVLNFQKALGASTFTLAGAGEAMAGVGDWTTGGASYKGCVTTRGVRNDTNTGTLKIKITTAPTGGTFGIKFDTQNSPTWAGDEYTISYDTSTGKVIPGSRCLSDYYEAFDENGLALGFDEDENRLPFEVFFSGDVRDLDLNAICEIPNMAQVAGIGTGKTGFPRRFLRGGRFTSANAFVYLNSGTVEATAAQITLATAKSPYAALGHEARMVNDFDETGDYEATFSLTRRYKDRTFEQLLQRNERFGMRLLLDGPPIQSAPGTFTGYRESVDITVTEAMVKDTKFNAKGSAPTDEVVTIIGVDPDDDSKPFMTVTAYLSEIFPIPA